MKYFLLIIAAVASLGLTPAHSAPSKASDCCCCAAKKACSHHVAK